MEKPWLKHYEANVPPTIDYPQVPLFKLMEETARKYPENAATLFFGGKLSWAELASLTDRFAAALAGLGVKKGDRVAILLPNCPQYIVAYYGILKAGGIVVPTNPLYSEREVEFQLNDSGAETIVTLTKFYPLVRNVRAKTKLKNVIVTNIKEYFSPLIRVLFTVFKEKKEGHRVEIDAGPGTYLFQDLVARYGADQAPKVDVSLSDVACYLYTGGTTGVPKGAVLTHRNVLVNAIQCKHWVPDLQEGKETILSVLPFFHSYGMTTCMNLGVCAAATVAMLPRFELHDVLKLINKVCPTLFPGVPTMYVAINHAPDVAKYNLRSIRACLSGAAGLPVEVQNRFEELTGGRLVEGYGLSEASPVTHANPIFGHRKVGSIGVPWPDTEAKIVDVETGERELALGEVGELIIRGPQVMREYWNKPEETKNALRNGWLYTGDIAKMDEDGYFYIVDRKKDMIIAGGFNVYPRDVEEVLYEHPKVKEAVVAGVPDEYRGETVKAYVVLKGGETATPEEVIEFCKGKMAKFKVPTQVEFRETLPKTMVGKVLRRVLVEEEKKKKGMA